MAGVQGDGNATASLKTVATDPASENTEQPQKVSTQKESGSTGETTPGNSEATAPAGEPEPVHKGGSGMAPPTATYTGDKSLTSSTVAGCLSSVWILILSLTSHALPFEAPKLWLK
jgi:hypothetical protein